MPSSPGEHLVTALDDATLVASAQSGDRAALDQLLRRHYDKIYAVCRRVTGNASDADDACQEALLKISRSLPRFDGRSAFTTWAYRIATNASLDELRKRKRRPALHSVRDGSEAPEVIDPIAAKRVEAVADRVALDEALAELSDDFRSAVILRDVADLDYSEIAEVLGVPIGTVTSRIARGRSTMADRLRLDSLLQGTVPVRPRQPDDTPLDNETLDDLIARDEAGLDGSTSSGSAESAPISDDRGNHAPPRERPRDST